MDGRINADIDIVDRPAGLAGLLSQVQTDGSVSRLALFGSVLIDSTMQLVARSTTGDIVLNGFRSLEGVIAGAWTDVHGYGGSFLVRRVPPAVNTFPSAQAVVPLKVLTGVPEPFSAATSSDFDGDALAFSWQILAKPAGSSSATLLYPQTPLPSFIADVAGRYTVQLLINDGRGGSSMRQFELEAFAASAINLSPAP